MRFPEAPHCLIDDLGFERTERKKFKRLLVAFLNGAGNKKLRNIFNTGVNFKDYMRRKFPILAETMDDLTKHCSSSKRNGVALTMMKIESALIGTHFMCGSEFDCVSIHDGILCKKSDSGKLIVAIKKRIKDIFGVEVSVERK